MREDTARTAIRIGWVLLAAAIVIGAAYALTPPYNFQQAEADQAREQAQEMAAAKAHPSPGGHESVLRQTIGDIANGAPDYAHMNKRLAAAVRQQLPQTEKILRRLGKVQALIRVPAPLPNFLMRLLSGSAVYELYWVQFQGGMLRWAISVGPDGTIQGLQFASATDRPDTPQQWIAEYAAIPWDGRGQRLATQLAVLLAAAAFGRLVLRIRL